MSTCNFIEVGPWSPKQCGPFIPQWRALSQRQHLETWMTGWHWSLKTLLHMDSAFDKDPVVLKWRPTAWEVLLGGFSEQKRVFWQSCVLESALVADDEIWDALFIKVPGPHTVSLMKWAYCFLTSGPKGFMPSLCFGLRLFLPVYIRCSLQLYITSKQPVNWFWDT